MKLVFEVICFILSASWVSTSISGVSYMDPIEQKPLKPFLPGEDPCNPLYWYPRHIPEYCYTTKPGQPKSPVPIPAPPSIMPVPIPPITVPMPYPMLPPIAFYPPPMLAFPPVPQFIPPPPPPQYLPSPQMPYGLPLPPTIPDIPYPGIPYPPIPPSRQQAGLVPGIPGLISPDGGINILPFSDAYSDMLEKHKQKMIRKRLQKVLDDYEDYPRKRKHRKHRRGRHH